MELHCAEIAPGAWADEDSGRIVSMKKGEACQFCFPVEPGKTQCVGFEPVFFVQRKLMDALIYGSHEYIAWAAGLVDSQKSPEAGPVDKGAVYMDQGALGQGGKRFVQAVNHEIRPCFDGRLREDGMHAEMRPVCFIYNQWNPLSVRDSCDLRNIGHYTVISGGGQEESARIRMPAERLLHLRRLYRPVQIVCRELRGVVRHPACSGVCMAAKNQRRFLPGMILPGIQVCGLKPVQGSGIVCGAVAVPGHQDTVSRAGAGTNRTKNTGCASIYQKMRFLAFVERCCPLLRFLQDPFCVMQVIKPVDLGEINIKRVTIRRITKRSRRVTKSSHAAFVPRHMEWICIR